MPYEAGLSVRIVTHESARAGHRTVVEALLSLARREGIAGATVTRAQEGYSADHGTRSADLADLEGDLPLTIELVDTVDRIERVLGEIATLVTTGALTVTPIRLYRR